MTKKYIFILWILLFLGCQTISDPESANQIVLPGQQAFANGQYANALDEIEAVIEVEKQNGPLWRLLGESYLRFAQERILQRDPGMYIQSLFEDSKRALEQAIALMPNDPHTKALLAQVAHLQGETESAYTLALQAQENLQHNTSAEIRFAVERTVAEAAFSQYIALKNQAAERIVEQDELVQVYSHTYQALRTCETLQPTDPWPYAKQADLFRWENAQDGAIDSLVRGIEQIPQDASLHMKLQELFPSGSYQELAALYEKLAASHPNSATVNWYLGLAKILYADDLQGQGEEAFPQAIAQYQKSKQAFSQSAQLEADYLDSVNYYSTVCDVSVGWVAYTLRKIDEAVNAWLEAINNHPENKDIQDSFQRSAKLGLAYVGQEYIQSQEFERAQKLFGKLIELDPQDADWMNNYAFLCREAGTLAERNGEEERAQRLYENSYTAYQNAVALQPNDARLINDCGLILFYHLHRDYDRAQTLFQRATQIGEQALANEDFATPLDPDVEVAVGDAYQNLGLLHLQINNDAQAALQFLQKSLQTGAESRPIVRLHINFILQMESMMKFWFPILSPLLFGTAETPAKAAALAENATSDAGQAVQHAADLYQQGEWDKALDLLDELSTKYPDIPDIKLLYGKTYYGKAQSMLADQTQGQMILITLDDAIANLRDAAKQMPDNGEAPLFLAKALFLSNRLDEANAAVESALQRMPKSAEAYLLQGNIQFAHYQKAMAEEDHANTDVYWQAAMQAFQTSTELDNKPADGWNKIGDLYAWRGAAAKAVDAYIEAFARMPSTEIADRIMTRISGEEMLAAFESAARLANKLGGKTQEEKGLIQWYLGIAAYSLDDHKRAKLALEKAVRLNKEFVNAYYYLGRIAYLNKQYEESLEAFNEYAQRMPQELANIAQQNDAGASNVSTLAILNFLEGHAYEKSKTDQARNIAHVNALINPSEAMRWNNYAFLCRETEKFEESYAAYLKALELEPDNPRYLNDCALILQYHLHRDYEKAAEMYAKAIAKANEIIEHEGKNLGSQSDIRVALKDATDNLRKLKPLLKK